MADEQLLRNLLQESQKKIKSFIFYIIVDIMMVELKIPHYLGAVDSSLDLFYYRLSLILYKDDLVFKIALNKNLEVVVGLIVSLSEDQLNYFRVNHCKIC
jgi:hypothetical protein